jgi:phosphoglycolate phosphatase-like HAD superfamily hydrolase
VAMEQHDLSPQRTVVVGDTVWDIESAQKAGLPCIALTCGGISRAELLGAGADEVFEDPADLLSGFAGSLLGRAAAG